MDIYVLRHGDAEERDTGLADRDRKLTAKGKRDLKEVLKIARKAEVAPDLILSQPAAAGSGDGGDRGRGTGLQERCRNRNLLPGASPEQIWKEISTDYKVDKILLAGHQPHLGSLIGLLLEAAIMVDLKKGSLVRIETHGKLGPPRGVLKWMITTKLAKAE